MLVDTGIAGWEYEANKTITAHEKGEFARIAAQPRSHRRRVIGRILP
jgi:hypothetical protein